MKKNVASQQVGAQMITAADGSAFTGAVSVAVTVDGGVQGAGGGTGPTHEGNGYHSYIPTQAETNGDHLAFTFTGTGAIPVTVQVYTTFPQTGDNFSRLGAPAGASVSADVAAVKTDTAAILTDTADMQPKLGTPAGASISADIAAIEAQTDDIGAAGAGLTAIPWNAAWDVEVQSEVADALDAAVPVTPTAGSINERVKTMDDADMPAAIAAVDDFVDTEVAAILAAVDTEVAAILADTNELQTDWANGGRLDLILDARASQASVDAVDDFVDTEVAAILAAVDTEVAAIKTVTDAIPVAAIGSGAAIAGTLSTTEMTTDLSEATNDHYNGRTLVWTSGVLAEQATNITDYDGATKKLVYTAVTEAPGIGDTFVIL